jgi:hypothetical protein
MPKDATKNVDRYKIRGGTLNEFEFTENQEAFAEEKHKDEGKLIPGTPPEKKTKGRRPMVAKKATKKTATKATAKKAAKKKAAVSARGASAKKLAARKAAKKKAAKKK